jgi:hypothetical protein
MKVKPIRIITVLCISALTSLSQSTYIDLSDKWYVRVGAAYDINNKWEVFERRGNRLEDYEGDKKGEFDLSQDIKDWDSQGDWTDSSVCWLTKRKKWKANPSLRTCYSTSDNACCNFKQDENIGGRISDFLPDACTKDGFGEITIFSCIPCRAEALEFYMKADPSEEYFQRAYDLFKVQNERMNITSQEFGDILRTQGNSHKGIVKVCSAWALRLWTDVKIEEVSVDATNVKQLGDKTYAFDHCGANDLKGDGSSIELGSLKPEWSDAAKFLNWLGLYESDGFVIVVVDNTFAEGKSPYKYKENETCFNQSR